MAIDYDYYVLANSQYKGIHDRGTITGDVQRAMDEDLKNNLITEFDMKIGMDFYRETVLVNFERELDCVIKFKRMKEAVYNSSARELQCVVGGVKTGDYIEHTNRQTPYDVRNYIVRNMIDPKHGYDSCFILICQKVLKGISSDNKIYEYPTHFIDNKTMLMESDSKLIDLPANIQQCYIQENEFTKEIDNRTRFISNGEAFQVVGIDRQTMNGILTLRLETTSFTPDDNKELEIADYYKTFPRDGGAPTEPTDPEVPTGSYSLTLSGSEEALSGFTEDYRVSIKLNGEDIGGKDIEWRISNADGTTTSYATIESVSGYDCTIKVGSTKYIGKSVILRAELVANSTIFDEKTIQIVGF